MTEAFYTLYIGLNDGGTSYSVFKLSTKQMIITPRCKSVPMPDDVIEVVNKTGKDEEMPDGIRFCNIHEESTPYDLHGDVESKDDNSYTSDESWDLPKDGVEIEYKNIVYNDDVNDDEIDDLDDEDALHLNDTLTNNNNNNNSNDNNEFDSRRGSDPRSQYNVLKCQLSVRESSGSNPSIVRSLLSVASGRL